jgi:hypothetical protein
MGVANTPRRFRSKKFHALRKVLGLRTFCNLDTSAQDGGLPIATGDSKHVTLLPLTIKVQILRWFVPICLSVALAVVTLATCPLPIAVPAPESVATDLPRTPNGWRYTTTGWKHIERPIAQEEKQPEAAIIYVHPVLLALLQILLSLAALIAFSSAAVGRATQPEDRSVETHSHFS